MKNVLWNQNLPIELLVEVSIEQQQVNDLNPIPFHHLLLFLFLVALNAEWKTLEGQNNEIRHEIKRCYSDLRKYDEKLQMLDNMTQLATQSLEVYFQTVRTSRIAIHSSEIFLSLANGEFANICYGTMSSYIGWYSRRSRSLERDSCYVTTVREGLEKFAEGMKWIYSRKLVVPGDLRSYGGGNGLPRAVKQSPNFSRIAEEEEVEEEEDKNDVTTLLVRFIFHSFVLISFYFSNLVR